MLKPLILFLFTSFISCNTGELKVLSDLPKSLKECSGIEKTSESDLIWMINDSGNSPKLYGVNEKGKIIKTLKIHAKNHDWEDLTSDREGNLYIGDFGNNDNNRKDLVILKVNKDSLNHSDKIVVEPIAFKYSDQEKSPPEKKYQYFDCEAFFHYNDSLFLFTKSQVHGALGITKLYKIPAQRGKHIAQLVSSFTTCSDSDCRITSADISSDGKTVILLTSKSVWVFTQFKGTAFFDGTSTELLFSHTSQKEAVCFKNNTVLYITDEKGKDNNGNLYEFKLKQVLKKSN